MLYYTNMEDTRSIFLNIEERARRYFERFPFTHAFLAGVGVILFWRGVWEIADIYRLDPILSIVIGVFILGAIGLFIQTFVGNAIIIKTVKKEINLEKKEVEEVTQVEKIIHAEEITLAHLAHKIDQLEEKINSLNK